MKLVIFGLTLSSSWGNGHATTYRSLLKALHRRGHEVHFFERNVEWYASNRDMPNPPFARLHLYEQWDEVRSAAWREMRTADAVIVGSYCPDALTILDEIFGEGSGKLDCPVGFYDIDTPITVTTLRKQECTYLRPAHLPKLDLYLSFTGGPLLEVLEKEFGVRRPRAFYCSADPDIYLPHEGLPEYAWDLGYMGTYAADRQPKLKELLLDPAARLGHLRFIVAGPLFPDIAEWPPNVCNFYHISPHQHPSFYHACRLHLNLTRRAMVEVGYSPSIRLFEAASCGVPVMSDEWAGIEEVFEPGREILIARNADDVVNALSDYDSGKLERMGRAARDRFLREHTGNHRAMQLEKELTAAGANISATHGAPQQGAPLNVAC